MRNWQKMLAAGLAAVMMAAVAAGCGGEQAKSSGSGSGAADNKKIGVGLDDNFPPMGFKGDDRVLI